MSQNKQEDTSFFQYAPKVPETPKTGNPFESPVAVGMGAPKSAEALGMEAAKTTSENQEARKSAAKKNS